VLLAHAIGSCLFVFSPSWVSRRNRRKLKRSRVYI
jgi:hypothetical protein